MVFGRVSETVPSNSMTSSFAMWILQWRAWPAWAGTMQRPKGGHSATNVPAPQKKR
jgi:hypothetical protein